MKGLDQIGEISGLTILLRADFNVPIKDGKVVDDRRILAALPTVRFLLGRNCKLIIVSHIESDGTDTLRPVYEEIKNNFPVSFVEANLDEIRSAKTGLQNGHMLLVENIRYFKGEKENFEEFAKEFSSLADIYVNEAFSVSHRNHSSIVGFPKFLPSFAGFQLQKEINELSRVFNPQRPFLFILGGAKFGTKEPLITKFLDIADYCFVGGALGNDFFKTKGYEVGGSMTSGTIVPPEILNNPKVIIPIDVVVRAADGRHVVRTPDKIMGQEIVSDAGPKTLEELKKHIMNSRMVLWNGPLGYYEKGFDAGTKEIALSLSKSRARSIVGGGDTTAAIENLGVADRFTFISTGGGAMLEFLAKGTLPGIEVLK